MERFYTEGDPRGVNPNHRTRLTWILDLLDAAQTPQAMNIPGLRLHPLKGDRRGFWAVNVSGNWRVTFGFETGHAVDVGYEDYH